MALTFTNLLGGNGFVGLSGTSGTITPTVAVAAGDLILIGYYVGGNTTFSSVNDSDAVNIQPYRVLCNFHDATNNFQVGILWKVAGQANSPATAINLTYSSAFINSFTMKVSGFTGTPTIGLINGTNFAQTVAGTGVVWSPLVTDANNEALLMVMDVTTGSSSSGFGSWSTLSNSLFRQAPATASTNVAVTAGVWSASTVWDAILGAMYDFPGIGSDLLTATNTDLVLYNQNWNYSQESSQNFILVGSTGAFCNNQTGGNTVNAIWAGNQFTADQQAQCVLASLVANASAGVGLRFSSGVSGPNGYVCYFDTAHYSVGVLNNGSFTSLSGGPQARSNNPGDVVTFQVRGNTLTLSVNGSTLKTITDNTWAAGAPALCFNGPHPSTIVDYFRAGSLGIILQPFTSNTIIGQVGATVSEALTHQTLASSSSSSGLSVSLTGTLSGITATFAEGNLIDFLSISGQTATFAEGTLTASISGGATLQLGQQTAQFVQNPLFDNISYVLDQGATVANLFSQTSTFTQGLLTLSVVPQLTAFTVSSTEGVIAPSITLSAATAQTITSVEGVLTAALGNNITTTLVGQTLASSEGLLGDEVDYFPTAQTATYTVGTITFSSSGSFAVQIGSQSGNFIEGILGVNIPSGAGPPLFIPPQLGKPVTTRTFSWSEMAQRAWGSEFRAPDHRIYQFSGGNYKDSTDLGTTGIYTNQQGPADNP